jgi:hypothetical protein
VIREDTVTAAVHDPHSVAVDAVAHAEAALAHERLGAIRVGQCFHYGAVDTDVRQLVVWVLLAGAPASELPEWFHTGDHRQRAWLDPALVAWTDRLRGIVQGEFADRSWPRPAEVTVQFDSEQRVRDGGGFYYFQTRPGGTGGADAPGPGPDGGTRRRPGRRAGLRRWPGPGRRPPGAPAAR